MFVYAASLQRGSHLQRWMDIRPIKMAYASTYSQRPSGKKRGVQRHSPGYQKQRAEPLSAPNLGLREGKRG